MINFTITEKQVDNQFKLIFKAENDIEETVIDCPNVDKDGLDNLMSDITDFLLSQLDEKSDLIVVQNSCEDDPIGIIVNIYGTVTENGIQEPETGTFCFEDYLSEEDFT